MVVKHERPELPESGEFRGSIIHQATRYLAGQEFNNVMLALILAALAALAWFGMPAMIAQIQLGYERAQTRYVEDATRTRQYYERTDEWKSQVIQTLLRERGIDLPNAPPRVPMSSATP